MRCYCGGKAPCFCHLTYVIYKLKCKKCSQCYIGKTIRELRIRISEHLRGCINGKRSALAKHACREGYEIRILARSENNSKALGVMEGKMMNKYKPKINIKNEKSACALAEKLGKALRKKDSCKPYDKFQRDNRNDDYEDQFEYWIEDSEFFSSEVECEDGNSTTSEAEANEKTNGQQDTTFNLNNVGIFDRLFELWILLLELIVAVAGDYAAIGNIIGQQDATFNPNNYDFLAKIKAHEHDRPFTTTTSGSYVMGVGIFDSLCEPWFVLWGGEVSEDESEEEAELATAIPAEALSAGAKVVARPPVAKVATQMMARTAVEGAVAGAVVTGATLAAATAGAKGAAMGAVLGPAGLIIGGTIGVTAGVAAVALSKIFR